MSCACCGAGVGGARARTRASKVPTNAGWLGHRQQRVKAAQLDVSTTPARRKAGVIIEGQLTGQHWTAAASWTVMSCTMSLTCMRARMPTLARVAHTHGRLGLPCWPELSAARSGRTGAAMALMVMRCSPSKRCGQWAKSRMRGKGGCQCAGLRREAQRASPDNHGTPAT